MRNLKGSCQSCLGRFQQVWQHLRLRQTGQSKELFRNYFSAADKSRENSDLDRESYDQKSRSNRFIWYNSTVKMSNELVRCGGHKDKTYISLLFHKRTPWRTVPSKNIPRMTRNSSISRIQLCVWSQAEDLKTRQEYLAYVQVGTTSKRPFGFIFLHKSDSTT